MSLFSVTIVSAAISIGGIIISPHVPSKESINEEFVLEISGLEFIARPTLVSQFVKRTGPADSNVIALAEFVLSDDDAIKFTKCDADGYAMGNVHALGLGFGIPRGGRFCWRTIGNGDIHFFALAGDRLFYRYVSL